MRASIMQGLRKAGDKLRNADDAYANWAAKLVMGENPGIARSMAGMAVGTPVTQRAQVTSDGTNGALMEALLKIAPYSTPVSSAAIRYGIPAAGAIGLAGMLNNGYQQLSQVDITGQPIEDPNLMVRQAPYIGA